MQLHSRRSPQPAPPRRPHSDRRVPLLGDFDGDGRVDACVFRAGAFLCDTAHDGGATPPTRLLFGRPGDRPLLGNLDGL